MPFLCYSSDPWLINVCLEINSGKRRSKGKRGGLGIGLGHSFLGFKHTHTHTYMDIVVHIFEEEKLQLQAV